MFGGVIANFLTITSMDCADKRLTQMFGQVYLLHFLMLKIVSHGSSFVGVINSLTWLILFFLWLW